MHARRNGVAGLVLAEWGRAPRRRRWPGGTRGTDCRPGRLSAFRSRRARESRPVLAVDADTLTALDIASRATWADKFRDSDRHTSRQRYRLTREWHFVDIELDEPTSTAACFGHPAATVPASEGPAKSCVVDRIAAFATELHDLPPASPERAIAFKFVLHLVGDVHQPLHAADHNDAGGNARRRWPALSRRSPTPPCFPAKPFARNAM